MEYRICFSDDPEGPNFDYDSKGDVVEGIELVLEDKGRLINLTITQKLPDESVLTLNILDQDPFVIKGILPALISLLGSARRKNLTSLEVRLTTQNLQKVQFAGGN
jgi:hypothetical protein